MRLIAFILSLVASGAFAQTATIDAAQAARARLSGAADQLARATEARDRVSALTATVQAYEDGLVALRDGMRRVTVREATLQAALDGQSEEIAELLAVLQSIERAPTPLLLLHPSGPAGTARSGMIVSDVTPALQARADQLKAQLQEVAALRAFQEGAVDVLQNGLNGAQAARAALSDAISDRRDLPRRFEDDPVQTALMVASSQTLDQFASLLSQMPQEGVLPDKETLRGTLPPPVNGTLLRKYRAADAAGQRRDGVLLATRPRSLVTTPSAATLRFKGPLLDYGTVAVLEPAADVLIVMAGLGEVFGEVGQVLPKGAALGLMAGTPQGADAILSAGAGADRSETLYIEVREDGAPVDPAGWFILE